MATIQKKNEEGTKWLLMVSDGFAGKKRVRPTKIFHGTEKQALKAAILFENEIKQGRYKAAGKGIKFTEFVEMWIKDYGDKHLAPKTLTRYIELLETRILPAIGHLRMDKLTPLTITRLLNDIADSPRRDKRPGKLSAQTVKHHYTCISTILQDAVEWDVIAENPCSRVKPPKVGKSRVKVFDEEETSAFLTALEGAPLKHRTLVWLEFATGLREGEIMGLEWGDIDFDGGTLTVERASQYLPGKGVYEKDPKTEESKRTLAIPINVVELLKQYKAEWNERKLKLGHLWKVAGTLDGFADLFAQAAGSEYMPGSGGAWQEGLKSLAGRELGQDLLERLRHLGTDAGPQIEALATLNDEQLQQFVALWREKNEEIRGGRLFVAWDGRPGHPYWPQKWLTRFLKRHNLPHCSFHSLRHLNATMQIKAGVPLKQISVRMGHADIGTTGNIYAEALKSVDRDAAEKLGELLENRDKKAAK